MQNIGMMTKVQLNTLLKSFPNSATINKTEIFIKVTAPNGQDVMTAANMGKMWHVRAVDGLINKK